MEKCLDRAFICPQWGALFPKARLHNLVATVSDHSPILQDTTGGAFRHDFDTFVLKMRGFWRKR